jgi:hypothetical protein
MGTIFQFCLDTRCNSRSNRTYWQDHTVDFIDPEFEKTEEQAENDLSCKKRSRSILKS